MSSYYFYLLIFSILSPLILSQYSNEEANSLQMLQLVNNIRLKNNIRPLCLSNKLVRAATAHSAYQAGISTMTHDGPISLGDRFVRQGYQPAAVAENVGFTSTPFIQVVFDIWMSSADHRANILDPAYVHFGAASSVSSKGMYYWTQLFAKPMNMAIDSCDFAAAATAARLSPAPVGFDVNGSWGGSSNYNNYTPGMKPSASCISVDNGINGKTLSCRMANPTINPATGPGPTQNNVNQNLFFNGANAISGTNNPNIVNNLPGYNGSTCTVIRTYPAPDGKGAVRVVSCKSDNPSSAPSEYSEYVPSGTAQSTANNPTILLNAGNNVDPSMSKTSMNGGYNLPGAAVIGYTPDSQALTRNNNYNSPTSGVMGGDQFVPESAGVNNPSGSNISNNDSFWT